DLKQLVELAYAEHQALVKLLGPEAAKQLDAATRSRQTHELLSHNLGRMPRIQELIADELAQLDAQAKQVEAKAGEAAAAGAGSAAAGSAAGSAADPKAEAMKQQIEQLEQAKQQMTHAEELRGQAATALAALDKALAGTGDPLPPAKQADTALTELRKLLFSV